MLIYGLLTSAFALPDLDVPHRTGAAAPQDAAVVVGIEDYFQLPNVPGAVSDAALMVEVLAETRGIPRSRIRVLDRGASREQILAAADEVAQLAAEGTAWLYFAGHGAASPQDGRRLLLGDDARPDLAVFESRSVAVDVLAQRLGAAGGQAVLLLDTCYTGVDRAGEALFDKRFAIPTRVRDEQRLANGAEPLIWTATSPGEWSGTLAGTGHGAFTWTVAGALRGWADTDQSGAITAQEASAYVAQALLAMQVTDQHPVMEGPTHAVLSEGRLEAAPDLRRDAPEVRDEAYLDRLEAVCGRTSGPQGRACATHRRSRGRCASRRGVGVATHRTGRTNRS